MTDERKELIDLIDGLPEDKVSTLLATARALSTPKAQREPLWPPKFVGSINHAVNGRTDTASRVDDYLTESGFGQDFRG